MKTINCNILDPEVPIQGFITKSGIAAVPWGNKLMIVYQGQQVKVCNNEKTARAHVKKLEKVNVSNLQSSPIV